MVGSKPFDIIKTKVNNEIRFWNRFDLSLPGQITACNTMIYFQLNYLGFTVKLTDPLTD